MNPYASPAPGICPAVVPAPVDEELEYERALLQARVNKMLNRGVIFSIIWVFGIGSFYSLYLAAKAHGIIRESNGSVRGMLRVWWCYFNAGFGALLFTAGLIVLIFNSLSA